MLTVERLKEILDYDPASGQWTWKEVNRNRMVKAGDEAGHITKRGYRIIVIDGKNLQSSRLAVLYMTGEWPSEEVDHRDLNKSNDQWENLRPATNQQNQGNTRSRGTTGAKGVFRCNSKKNPFVAKIGVDGKFRHLGVFPTVEAASNAYMAAAREAFGEFARAS